MSIITLKEYALFFSGFMTLNETKLFPFLGQLGLPKLLLFPKCNNESIFISYFKFRSLYTEVKSVWESPNDDIMSLKHLVLPYTVYFPMML